MKTTEKKVKKCSMYKVLKDLSIETWERIGFARSRSGLIIYETTITQNILYVLKKYSEASVGANIEMYEAFNEKTNGNDIEICIKTNKGFILVPTQAKILYRSGKYDKINHPNQIENLLKYANNVGGIPAHLFYNYHDIFSQSEYGCTMMETNDILKDFSRKGTCKVKIPSFSDLHPSKASPWHKFICDLIEAEKENHSKEEAQEEETICYYSREELLEEKGWKEIQLNEYKSEIFSNDTEEVYAPRYRVFLEIENQG